MRFDVIEPLQRIALTVSDNDGGVAGELEWTSSFTAQEERHHFVRQWGRVLEDYSRYDQIGTVSGRLTIDGTPIDVDSWWACRDHSWGVRERVGIPEPFTGEVPQRTGSLFAFLFFSTDTHGGHIQVSVREGATHLTAAVVDRSTGAMATGERVALDASFVDDSRPRRFDRVVLEVTDADGETTQYEVEAPGPAVAMPGLGYGGYDDGLGLGVHRGVEHLEHEVWDAHPPPSSVSPTARSIDRSTASSRSGHPDRPGRHHHRGQRQPDLHRRDRARRRRPSPARSVVSAIPVAVVGTSFGGRVHVPALRAAGFDVVALVGRNPERTRRRADELGVTLGTVDLG